VNPADPGDIGFARTTGIMGRLIRLGEWLKFRTARWNHKFIVSDLVDVDGMPFVIQATMEGVTETCRLDEVAPGGVAVTMPPPPECDVAKLLEFAKAQVGIEYGFLTDVAMAIDIVTWDWVPSFRSARKPSWQCAALACEALRYAGWLHEWPDIYSILPDEGYEALLG
jgi:hypothetical protein